MFSLKKILALTSLMLIIVEVNSASLSRQRRFIKGAFLKTKKTAVAAPGPLVVTVPVARPVIPGSLKKFKKLAKLKKLKKLGALGTLDPTALTGADLPLLTAAGLTPSDLAYLESAGLTPADLAPLDADDYGKGAYADHDDDDYGAPAGPYSNAYGAAPYGGAPGPYSAAPGPYGAAPGPYEAAPGPYGAAPGPYGAAPGPYGNGAYAAGNGHGPYDDDDHDDLPYGNGYGLQPQVRVFYINRPVPAPYPAAAYGSAPPAALPYAAPSPNLYANGHK